MILMKFVLLINYSKEKIIFRKVKSIGSSKIDSEFRKCPIFVGSVENFGNSWGKNKHVGLISDQNWSSS